MDQRNSIAEMRGPDAGKLARVLARFHERDRIEADVRRPAILAYEFDKFGRRACRVEADFFAGRFGRDIVGEPRGLLDPGEFAQPSANAVRELAAIEVKGGPALARNETITERQRRMRDIAPAAVECPCESSGIAAQHRVGAS